MKKGQMTKAIIYLVLFLGLIFSFVLLFGNASNSIFGMDLGCRWTAQLSASGMPVALRCPVQYIELNDRLVDDELKLKNKIAEEMANCFGKFGSGKYESLRSTSTVRWALEPRRSLGLKWNSITGASSCHICSYVYTEDEERNMELGNFSQHLENTVPRGSDRTYSEIMYERDNVHESLSLMKSKEYNSPGYFIIYAEKEKTNAVFLADDEFMQSSNICGTIAFGEVNNEQ